MCGGVGGSDNICERRKKSVKHLQTFKTRHNLKNKIDKTDFRNLHYKFYQFI